VTTAQWIIDASARAAVIFAPEFGRVPTSDECRMIFAQMLAACLLLMTTY